MKQSLKTPLLTISMRFLSLSCLLWQDPSNLLSLTEWLALAYCRPLDDPGLTAPLSNLNRLRFFPESERTGPPVGGRPHSTVQDTPGARGRRAQAVREMTMVSTKAARDNAFSAEIRQSSHCQQEEQSRAAAAVGSHHEKGCRAHPTDVATIDSSQC